MISQLLKTASLSLLAAASICAGAAAAPAAALHVSLTQAPVVMRLSNDEFRIAFGIDGGRCAETGCRGVIRYRVYWKTEDGRTRSEIKQVSYALAPRASRTITVDRQYFDTAEGAHTTDVVKVRVETISCREGLAASI
ncbi:MAG TPA: hypothetical protein VMV25_09350 [Steroidobacteraceae bacterium]|nr:hypothetical protein [Steroidobacteraceae bacterium]